MTGNIQDAEDIVQITFLQAYHHIKSFKGNSELSTWIYKIGKNECFKHLRNLKKGKFENIENLAAEARKLELAKFKNEEEEFDLIDQVKEGCLTGLLQCLSVYQRSAFTLHILFKHSIKETSSILEKSEGATKALVFRARQNLKEFLCKNCSLYNPANNCECKDLVSFSLNQGWIRKPSGKKIKNSIAINTKQIETELKTYRKTIEIYQALKNKKPSISLPNRIKEDLNQEKPLFHLKKS